MANLREKQPAAADAEELRGHVALKGFFNICREWDCTQEEMMQMLGGVSRSTLYKYQKLPYIKLSRDLLERISYVLGIYKSLRLMYPTAERANRRVRLPTTELPFTGTSAMDYMTRGSMRHLMQTRRYFDAKRGWA
ncbi:antitoxin Xre-like helix-turn-helix domain-containing protein [Marinobacter salicampi]|uniref:antitoxin Xre-like helix-turn-helix domain-containing protein n=1 Tax=Marinobacter salicampi TaxID=435907 RepID=UPI00140AD751|nr:antitoxin Xre-like helix-turn-helix domain-containing protein [Marinobacter salicampi]